MEDWSSLGKLVIAAGVGLVLVGLILVFGERLSWAGSWFGWIGRLPGDLSIKRDHFSFYFPLGTSLVLSVVLSLVFYLVSWLFRR